MTIVAHPRSRRQRQEPPPAPDRVTAYAASVLADEIVVGRLVRLACERHMRDIEAGAERGLRWRPDLAELAIDFFPEFCTHFEGPKAGKAFELEPWQCFIEGSIDGWQRWDEERQVWVRRFRSTFEEVGKKNGKTIRSAGRALKEAFFRGEPGAQVYAIASKRDQAKIAWGGAKTMVEKSPALRSVIGVRALSLFHHGTNSMFKPLGKDTKTEDGLNPSYVLVDEEHRLEDRELIDLMRDSFGARQEPLLSVITTAGTIGQSVWVDDHDYAAKVLEGLIEDDQLFAYIANLDPGDDPFDEANWVKPNPNLGVSVRWDDMRTRAKAAREKPSEMNSFLRLRLNVRTQSVNRWMTPDLWRSNGAPPKPLAGRVAYGGLDLGAIHDLSALVLLVPDDDDGMIDLHCRFWVPQNAIEDRSRKDRVPYDRWVADGLITATPGDVTDYDVIRADINALVNPEDAEADRADIYEIAFDPHDATQLVNQMQSDGFRMVLIQQSTMQMDPAVSEVERLLSRQQIRHGNHPVLGWMVDNVLMSEDAAGRRRPDKSKARERIDGVPAMLMALKRWMAHAGAEMTWTAA